MDRDTERRATSSQPTGSEYYIGDNNSQLEVWVCQCVPTSLTLIVLIVAHYHHDHDKVKPHAGAKPSAM